MEVSHTAVHPVAVPPALLQPPARVRMKDYQGMPGTLGGLALRLGQLGFAVLAFSIMISTPDFGQVTAFRLVFSFKLPCFFVLSFKFFHMPLAIFVYVDVVDGFICII
mgnify:FL=1